MSTAEPDAAVDDFVADTRHIRQWVDRQTVPTDRLLAELRGWTRELSGGGCEVTEGLTWLRDRAAGLGNVQWDDRTGKWSVRFWINSRSEPALHGAGDTVLEAIEDACSQVLGNDRWRTHAGGWS